MENVKIWVKQYSIIIQHNRYIYLKIKINIFWLVLIIKRKSDNTEIVLYFKWLKTSLQMDKT